MSYLIIIYSTILLVAGLYFLWLYFQFCKGKIPINESVGIRTKHTMANEEIWIKVHKKYSFVFLILCISFISNAVFSICQLIYNGSADKIPHINYMLSFTPLSIGVIITIISCIFANRYAKMLPPPRHKTKLITA